MDDNAPALPQGFLGGKGIGSDVVSDFNKLRSLVSKVVQAPTDGIIQVGSRDAMEEDGTAGEQAQHEELEGEMIKKARNIDEEMGEQ